ncbi:zwei Ig domain protein zig-8-like isoform X2 [Daphnia pulicaria]|uniref:zwei Ig domain protein zig-8-like isoform X2 n=1 Tax=Daphnia pulicaria TaxID=35523 RepID=UPI001EEC014D|nr:zwei Ig domain protein zig-8-like isoform X2 [Daphnia pulicaria]
MERHSTSSSSLPKPRARYWQWILFALLTLECRTGLCSDVNEPAAAAAVAPSSEWAIVESSSPPASLAGTYVADADFDVMPTEVRVAAGTTAYLSCRPRSLRNKTVSWVRHRDLHILSVGRSVYTKDGRFSVYHQRHTGEWTLQLRSVQLKDSGLYECQIGTQPTRSYFVHLQVVEPTTSIFGGPDMHVHEGSPVNLSCLVSQAVGQPEFFFWYHNGQVMEFGGDRIEKRQYFAETDVTVSSLLIKAAHVSDSGNYTCQPAHCPPVSAKVYILKGEQPAAMQRSGSSLMMNAAGYWWRLSLVAVAMCYSSYSVGLLSLPMSVFVLVSLTTVPNLG